MPKIQMVACHYANRSGRGVPACFLPLEAVRDLVEAGEAVWDRKTKYVNFTKTEAEMPRAARSLKPGLSVMQGYVEGKPTDVAIIDAYRWAA